MEACASPSIGLLMCKMLGWGVSCSLKTSCKSASVNGCAAGEITGVKSQPDCTFRLLDYRL